MADTISPPTVTDALLTRCITTLMFSLTYVGNFEIASKNLVPGESVD